MILEPGKAGEQNAVRRRLRQEQRDCGKGDVQGAQQQPAEHALQGRHRAVARGFPLHIDPGLGRIRIVGGKADQAGDQAGGHGPQPDPHPCGQGEKGTAEHAVRKNRQARQKARRGGEKVPAEGQADAEGVQHRVIVRPGVAVDVDDMGTSTMGMWWRLQ